MFKICFNQIPSIIALTHCHLKVAVLPHTLGCGKNQILFEDDPTAEATRSLTQQRLEIDEYKYTM